MKDDGPGAATLLLEKWRGGDDDARERLIVLLHGEMRGVAGRLMRSERRDHTLQPTAVVNEACLRFLGGGKVPAQTRGDFLGLAAHVMRQVLVDHARRRSAGKRGADRTRVSLSDVSDAFADSGSSGGASGGRGEGRLIDALALDEAMTRLARLSPRQAQVAELRYFGGLSVEESAAALGISRTTVKAEWSVARLWLKRELDGGGTARGGPEEGDPSEEGGPTDGGDAPGSAP